MEFIMENGILIIAAVAVGIYIGMGVYSFFNRPRSEQMHDVREWLIWAVDRAEEELGTGTGPMKLRMVYDMFVTRFPAAARFVGFETFKGMVDEALENLEKMLKKEAAAHADHCS